MMTPPNLSYPHRYCSNNRALIAVSDSCGCFYCLETFPGTDVVEWIHEDPRKPANTALCPRCGIDSVLPSPPVELNKKFLAAMDKHWFERTT